MFTNTVRRVFSWGFGRFHFSIKKSIKKATKKLLYKILARMSSWSTTKIFSNSNYESIHLIIFHKVACVLRIIWQKKIKQECMRFLLEKKIYSFQLPYRHESIFALLPFFSAVIFFALSDTVQGQRKKGKKKQKYTFLSSIISIPSPFYLGVTLHNHIYAFSLGITFANILPTFREFSAAVAFVLALFPFLPSLFLRNTSRTVFFVRVKKICTYKNISPQLQ